MKGYIAYIDILGFYNLPKMLSKCSGFDENIIRYQFISKPVIEKMEELKCIYEKGISEIEIGSDNYIITFNSLIELFKSINALSNIKIPHRCYGTIPLEIALDITNSTEYDVGITKNSDIIESLQNDIISPYKSYYKEKHDVSIRETFIVATEDFSNELDPLYKDSCFIVPNSNRSMLLNLEKLHEKCLVFDFLQHIGHREDDKLYGSINELYVEPVEYNDIKKSLENKKIVFLTGTAEYGKTYTAIRLLWEYFLKGYTPKLVKGLSPQEREEGRIKLHEIENELEENNIIYFEDPFGRAGYEGSGHILEEYMELPDIIKNYDNVLVVITSRGEIFNEYLRNISIDLKKYEKTLNIKKPSYDSQRRQKILKLWAGSLKCNWMNNHELKTFVFEEIKDDRVLPTPLNLSNFAKSTIEITEKSTLGEKLKEISVKTPITFAKEVKQMNSNKILLLTYPFISDEFEVEFVRNEYNYMSQNLNLEDVNFDELLEFFEDYKLDTTNNKISFYHPAYAEALSHILSEKGRITIINKDIFGPVLINLSKSEKAIPDFIKTTTIHYKNLPKIVQKKLIEFSNNNQFSNILTKIVVPHFEFLDKEIGQEILYNVLTKGSAKDLSTVIRFNFQSLPKDILEDILSRFIDYEETFRDLKLILKENFNLITEENREFLFFSLFNKKNYTDLISIILNYFDIISKKTDLIEKILIYDPNFENLFNRLFLNFDDFNLDSVENLILKLYQFDEARSNISLLLKDNFPKYSEGFRNYLFLDLSKDIDFKEDVISILSNNFEFVDEGFRNDLLLDLSNDPKYQCSAMEIIIYNFKILNEDIQSLGEKLLINLIKDVNLSADAISIFSKNFASMNEGFRNDLLLDLSNDPKYQCSAMEIIIYNFKILPIPIQDILLELFYSSENIKDFNFLISNHLIMLLKTDRYEAIKLISKKMGRLNKHFVLDLLQILSYDSNSEINHISITLIDELNSNFF